MFKPLQGYILVLPIERKQSETLWVTPEKFTRGLVVAVGPCEHLKKNGEQINTIRPMQVKPGDFITYGDLDWIYPKYTEDGIEYRILEDKDVTFVLDEYKLLDDSRIQELLAKHRPSLQSLGITHVG